MLAPKEHIDGANVIDFGVRGRRAKILFEGELSPNTGFSFLNGPSYRAAGEIISQEGALFIYRPFTGSNKTIRLYLYGDEGEIKLVGEGALNQDWDNLSLEIDLELTLDGAFTMSVKELDNPTPIIVYSPQRTDYHPPVAGTVGGAYIAHNTASGDFKVVIRKAVIQFF